MARLNFEGRFAHFVYPRWDGFSIADLLIRRNTIPLLLWLLGVPITVIIILLLLGVF